MGGVADLTVQGPSALARRRMGDDDEVMDRLSALDAEFLHVEDGISHMHIAGVCVFGDPPPSPAQLAELIEAKLHLIPRYRQRVRTVPLDLGRPVWVSDPHFNLAYHLRHTALPAPGDDAELCDLMGRLMSQPLDRYRPLWEAWLVEGLSGGRWALIFKVHHCMVDGIAGVGLLSALLDVEADVELPEPEPWSPEPEPSDVARVLRSWSGLAGDTLGWARQVPKALHDPIGAIRTAVGTGAGLVRFVSKLGITPSLSIDGAIGPHRVWAHGAVELADIAVVRRALGGTVNDVVLAAVTAGFRSLLLSGGDDLGTATVRTLVPVSVRGAEGGSFSDNRVSALLLDLPVHVADPVERLRAVQSAMRTLKGSHMAGAAEVVTHAGDLVPPMLAEMATRLALRAMQHHPQHSISTVTTNVPGPQFPLYCLGREMLEYLPFVPISYGIAIGTAILSYNGHVSFGVTGDYDTAPEVGTLVDAVLIGVDELVAAARNRSGRL